MYAGNHRHHDLLGVHLPVPIIVSLVRPPKTKRRDIARFTYERPHLHPCVHVYLLYYLLAFTCCM